MAEYQNAVHTLAEAVRMFQLSPQDPRASEQVKAATSASAAAALALQEHSRRHSC